MENGESEIIKFGKFDYLIDPAVQLYNSVKSRGAEITPRKALEESLKIPHFKDPIKKTVFIYNIAFSDVVPEEIDEASKASFKSIPTMYDELAATEDGRRALDMLESLLLQKLGLPIDSQ